MTLPFGDFLFSRPGWLNVSATIGVGSGLSNFDSE